MSEMDCKHLDFDAFVKVNRIQKSESEPDEIVAYVADLKVTCHDCGQAFEFIGAPCGMSFYRPTLSVNCDELHIPLVIPGTQPPDGLAGYSVNFQSFDQATKH